LSDTDALVTRVEELTAQLESIGDPFAEELAGALMEMYGEGLARIFAAIDEEGADRLRERLTEDGVVASLMLIHDLYPVPLEERVTRALDSVRPYMESHGGNIEMLGFEDGVVKLRLQGSCKSCRASSSTLELAVRQALQEAAPDLLGMDVEGVVEDTEEVTGIPLPLLNGSPGWHPLDIEAPELLAATAVEGMSLVVANVDGTLLAFRDRCASCNSAIAAGTLDHGALTCPSCGRTFFLPQAGRSLDDDHLQLQPIPLLREAEEIRVAM
jgi:Fe-S cluster biogenesis protein NfuA/nitrite reductase/ring-hydroxylating ferredoxin subunit